VAVQPDTTAVAWVVTLVRPELQEAAVEVEVGLASSTKTMLPQSLWRLAAVEAQVEQAVASTSSVRAVTTKLQPTEPA
jgi:hypothetical protein